MESAGEYDYVIVGAGTAGCLLANRLTRRSDLHCIGNPRTDWLFRTDPEPGLHGRALLYPRGKALGGSSSINGMIYMRGQAEDDARWAAASGDPSEDHHLGASAIHGGGEWRADSHAPPKITPNYPSTPDDRKMAAAALVLTRRIVASPALAKYPPQVCKPGLPYRSEDTSMESAGSPRERQAH